MKSVTAELIYSYHASLGEGALWDDRRARLWWVDITQGHLHCFDPHAKTDECFDVGSPVGTVVLDEAGDVLLAVQNGFARYDTESRELTMLKVVEHKNPSVRFNDGKCDPDGRFWAGTLAQDGTPHVGTLYCLERDLSLSTKLEGVSISNGIVWNHAKTYMYYIDTPTQQVVRYDYKNDTGEITSPQTIITIEEKAGSPDGMCIDADGMLWVALWDGGKVIRIDPEKGEIIAEVLVPHVGQITSCALGGENGTTLFITTARQGFTEKEVEEQPTAGSLFSAEVGVRGVPTARFKKA